ncbi:hypothetical protein ACIQ9E_25720 [Streptomyces sp. NPDC094448]|uniref:hypothetical protein n=1 Tax=Streptomyces sp. NPDC094448 TaxID=3366063 RepID=UPI00380FF130
MTATPDQGGELRCAHCGRGLVCGQPTAGGQPCPGQFHSGSGEILCFPEQGADGPRARPVHDCTCRAPGLAPAVTEPAPPRPPGADGTTAAAVRAGRPMTRKEYLAAIGKAVLGPVGARGPEPDVVVLPNGAGVCVVQPVRGGGKVYVAHDETVLFAPSSMDFATGLAAFLDGARTTRES